MGIYTKDKQSLAKYWGLGINWIGNLRIDSSVDRAPAF